MNMLSSFKSRYMKTTFLRKCTWKNTLDNPDIDNIESCNVSDECSSPSVWSVFGELASQTGAANLGQGFPDWNPSD
jgi:hypothetical protein